MCERMVLSGGGGGGIRSSSISFSTVFSSYHYVCITIVAVEV